VQDNKHDLIVIGAGPAALSAAIYTTREDIETLLFEKGVIGGLAAITEHIENYPGFPKGVGGIELSKNLQEQAERFGAKIELGEVSGLAVEGDMKKLKTTSGELLARAVLIATGNDYKHAGVPGEEEYLNRGVHYCATCDGPLYKDKKMLVIGGGNSAVQESLYLAKLASHVDVLIRKDHFRASDVLVKELEANPKIKVHFNTVATSIEGEQLVNKVKIKNNETKKTAVIDTEAVFVFVGLVPNTQFLTDSGIELDERGFIKTNDALETNVDGVFCAGDVRSGATEQIASAVGEGANAALQIRAYLDKRESARSYSEG
jgi:thioredoxin reductase (NADPH)